MSRPRPKILLEWTDPKTYKSEQILKADAIYAVFYDDKPINFRSVNALDDNPAKYKKVSFSNPGHAFNFADKMNKMFRTDKFKVFKLSHGEEIKENPNT